MTCSDPYISSVCNCDHDYFELLVTDERDTQSRSSGSRAISGVSAKTSALNPPLGEASSVAAPWDIYPTSCSIAWLSSAVVDFSRLGNSSRSRRLRLAPRVSRKGSSCLRPRSRHNPFLRRVMAVRGLLPSVPQLPAVHGRVDTCHYTPGAGTLRRMEHNEALLRDLEAIVSKHKPTAAELGAAVADLLYYAGIDGRPNLADAFTVLGKARDARAGGR